MSTFWAYSGLSAIAQQQSVPQASATQWTSDQNTTGHVVLPAPDAGKNDYLLAIFGIDGPLPSITVPTGWTEIAQPGTINPGLWVGYKLLSGASASTYTWSLTDTARPWSGTIIKVVGADQTNFLDTNVSTLEGTGSTTLVLPSITTVTAGTLLVAAYAANAAGNGTRWTPPSGYTEIYDSPSGKSSGVNIREWSSSGSTGTVTGTYSGSPRLVGALLAIRPATSIVYSIEEEFEGATAGTNLSTSNTIFGNLSASGTATFVNDPRPAYGSTCAKFVTTGTNYQGREYTLLPGPTNGGAAITDLYARFYVRSDSNPSGVNKLILIEASVANGSGNIGAVRQNTSGQIQMVDGPSTNSTASTHVVDSTGWTRIEWRLNPGTNTQTLRMWWGDDLHNPSTSATNYETISHTAGVTTDMEVWGVGNYNNVTATTYFDAVKLSSGAWIGPVVPAAPNRVQTASATSTGTSTTVNFSAAVKDNLLLVIAAMDKAAGTITPPSGYTSIFSNSSTSVSFWMGYKVAAGGETSAVVTRSTSSAGGDYVWMGEYESNALGDWTVAGSSSNYTNESSVTTLATGTTGTTTTLGRAIAAIATDSGVTSFTDFSNQYSTEFISTTSGGRAGLYVAARSPIFTGATTNTTATWTGADEASGGVAVIGRVVSSSTFALTQNEYRFYSGLEVEASATAQAAQSTALDADLYYYDTKELALRIRLQETGAVAGAATDDYKLQYRKNSGSWGDLDSAVKAYNSSNLTEGAATTNRLGAGTGSFVAGKVSEDGVVDDVQITASNYTELYYAIQLDLAGGLVDEDLIEFRVLKNNATTGMTYSSYPTLTVKSMALTQAAYRFYSDGTESGSTALGTQSTAYTLATNTDQNIGVRVRVQETLGGLSTDLYDLHYRTNGGSWTLVGASTAVKNYNSPNTTNNGATTNRLGAGSGSFVAGKIFEQGSAGQTIALTGNNYTEILYQVTVQAASFNNADVVEFKIVSGDGSRWTYSSTPTLNIDKTVIKAGSDSTLVTGTDTRLTTLVTRTPSTDTTQISSSETSSFATVAVSGTDSTLITGTDTSTGITASRTTTDSTLISSSETGAFGTVAVTGNDSTLITGSDATVSIVASRTTSDSTLVSSSETSAFANVAVAGSDSTLVTGSDIVSATLVTRTPSTDTTQISSSETSAFSTVAVTASDTTQISSSETSSFATVAVSGTDSTLVSSSESSAAYINLPGTDSTLISSSETSSFATVQVVGSDSTLVTATDASVSVVASRTTTDTTDISSTDNMQTLLVTRTPSTDTTLISSSETSSFGTVAVTSSDSTLVTGVDATFVLFVTRTPSTDTTQISSSETSGFATIPIAGSDATSISSSETSAFANVAVAGTDATLVTGRDSSIYPGGQTGNLFNWSPSGTGNITTSNSPWGTVGGGTGGFVYDTNGLTSNGLSSTSAKGITSGNTPYFKTGTFTASDVVYTRFYARFQAFASSLNRFVSLNSTSDTVTVGNIRIITGGIPRLYNSSGSQVGSSGSAIPVDTWIRMETKFDKTAGTIELRIYSTNAQGSTADDTLSGSATISAQMDGAWFGYSASIASGNDFWIDEVAVSNTGWLGPASNVPGETVINSFMTTTDTTQIAGTDIVATTNVAMATTDTTSISSSETSSFATVTVTASDSTQISSSDSGVVYVNQPGTDSTQISSSETVDLVISGVVDIVVSDTTNITGSDVAGTIIASRSTSDSTNISSSETSSFATVAVSASDATQISSAETSATFLDRVVYDSTSISSSETSAFAIVQVSGTDSTLISSSEGRTIAGFISTADTTSVSSSETSTTQVPRSATDSTQISSSETSSFATVQVIGSDATLIGSSDAGSVQSGLPGTDATAISSSETSSIEASGTDDKAAVDSTLISSSETSSVAVYFISTDSTQISSSETSAFATVTVVGSDATQISSSETSNFANVAVVGSDVTQVTGADTAGTINAYLASSDSTQISSSDSSSISADGTDDKASADATSIGSSETSSTVVSLSTTDSTQISGGEAYVFNTQPITSSDSTQISSAETSAFATVNVAATDTTNITGAEVAAVNVFFASSDSTQISSTEASDFGNVGVSGTDSTAISSNESGSVYANLPGADATQISSVETSELEIAGDVDKSVTDATSITTSETSAITASVQATDATNIGSTDSGNALKDGSADSTVISSTETSSISVAISTNDATQINSSESVDKQVFGQVDVTSADNTAVGSTETSNVYVTLLRTDTTNIFSSETNSFGPIPIAAADSTQILLPEVSEFGPVDVYGNDTTEITSTDSALVTIHNAATDTTQITSTEQSNVEILTYFPLSTTDSTEISSSETVIIELDFADSDDTEISSSETSQISTSRPEPISSHVTTSSSAIDIETRSDTAQVITTEIDTSGGVSSGS